MQTSLTPQPTAPVRLPTDLAAYLARFDLALGDLLTTSNPKLTKRADLARAVILHHLPARALAAAITPGHAGTTAPRSYISSLAALAEREGLTAQALSHHGCPWATAGCAAGCLNWAGHGGLSPAVAAARGRRTLAMLASPELYARAMLWAIAREGAKAEAQGLPLAVRLRGTDEGPAIGWHRLRFELPLSEALALGRRYGLAITPGHAVTLPETFACSTDKGQILWYDYSKAPVWGPLGLKAQGRAGWDLTASMAADRATATRDAAEALRFGYRLAVPVAMAKGQPMPSALELTHGGATLTVPAINGDLSDHRWADPEGVAVILRTKISRGAGPAAAAFSLRPSPDWQSLPDGQARLIW